jgi:hypothetical protein
LAKLPVAGRRWRALIREEHGGHSSLPLSYRIIARPLDMPLARRLTDARTAAAFPTYDDAEDRDVDTARKAIRARLMHRRIGARLSH